MSNPSKKINKNKDKIKSKKCPEGPGKQRIRQLKDSSSSNSSFRSYRATAAKAAGSMLATSGEDHIISLAALI
jgi:hypothetical protein